ncbi:hypothetical protein DYI24_00965 [Rhodopseudomonas sp. BR0C11]|uniref:group I intron-associated PD-(D/E)XK endonuclease n=1 Tax=Rhodopseudomonas sp. BR0C11 TaxID=2269370 RepID=UPI0013E0C1D3|nr:hypothetical protein [Rhodopseudomonas sp. BR0C11]
MAGSNPAPRTIFSHAKNTKQQGNVGLGLAIAHYVSEMVTVSVPLNDSQDYDLVVDKGGGLKRVQVKTCRMARAGQFEVTLSMQGGNRKANYLGKTGDQFSYDILFVVTADGQKYEIPRAAIQHLKFKLTLPSAAYMQFLV